MDRKDKLPEVIEFASRLLSGNDLAFYQRVWRTDLETYRSRLRAIQFEGLKNVLDAGCGMGQWTLCLSGLNHHVCAIDSLSNRVETVRGILRGLGVSNVELRAQSIEALEFPDQHFDGIFCYGVLMMADFQKALREFYRVLKPGGKVYLSTTGLGWYIFNLVTPYHPAEDYDPRQMAIDALENTLAFCEEGVRRPETQLVIQSSYLKKEMEAIGFENLLVGGEGTLRLDPNPNLSLKSFFASEHYGLENVYEVLAWRLGFVG
jgi:ubiquinone/menaquinone biosynthesis C-methylase UbiE